MDFFNFKGIEVLMSDIVLWLGIALILGFLTGWYSAKPAEEKT